MTTWLLMFSAVIVADAVFVLLAIAVLHALQGDEPDEERLEEQEERFAANSHSCRVCRRPMRQRASGPQHGICASCREDMKALDRRARRKLLMLPRELELYRASGPFVADALRGTDDGVEAVSLEPEASEPLTAGDLDDLGLTDTMSFLAYCLEVEA